MGVLRNLANRERRSFGESAARIPGPMDQARSFAGPLVTPDTALAHVDVWKCRSLIADAVAMLPVRAYQNTAWVDDNGYQRTYAEKAAAQPLLFTDPMPGDLASEFNFKHRLVDSILGDGNAYAEVAAVDQRGMPSALYPVHPSCVRDVKLDAAGRIVFEMHDGRLMGSVRDGGTMVHIPGYIQAGSLRGLSPIAAGRQAIALNMAAEEFGARWFGDGANPSGYLKVAGDISPDDAKALKRQWVQTYGGLSREPAVLYGGLEWSPISISPDESQFIETRRFQSGQIAALYRVPPHLVGDVDKTTSWGTGIEEMGLGFVTYTLGPWLTRIEQALSFLLPPGQFARFNVSALLRGRVEDQYSSFARGIQNGFLSTNDVRQVLDLPPVPGGDTYLRYLAQTSIDTEPPPQPPLPSDGTQP